MTEWIRKVNVWLGRDIKIIRARVPRAVVVGVLAVIFMYTAVAGTLSMVVPWSNRSDTQFHIDYIWEVHNGSLPRFGEGIDYPPLETNSRVHLTASHPPLFYAIHAVFLGPLLERGNWQEAIAVGRAINVFIGVLCVVALAWAGWVFGGRSRAAMAVAVPAIGALLYRFTTLNVNFANDVLLILFTILALIIIHKLLNRGLMARYVVGLGVISVLGMATKATYVVTLVVSILAVLIAAYIHRKEIGRRWFPRALLYGGLVIVAVVVSIGWFYYLNYQASGSWFKSSPDDFAGGREYRSLKDVLFGSDLWMLFSAQSSNAPYLATAITSVAAAGTLLLLPMKRFGARLKSFYKNNQATFFIILLLIMTLAGVVLTQIRHSVGYGSINFRYLLPALLPISLFLAYGLLQYKPVRGLLVSVAAIATAAVTILTVASSSTILEQVPAVAAAGRIEKIFVAGASNGVPSGMQAALLVAFVIGSVLLVWMLYLLSRLRHTAVRRRSSK